MPEGISDLVVTGYLEKPLRCPNDFTPFVHKISRFYVSYSRGWWGSESIYFFRNAKFPEWIAAFGYDLPMVLDPYHDPYFFKPNDPNPSNWTLWVTFGGAVKVGWLTPPAGSPIKRRDE